MARSRRKNGGPTRGRFKRKKLGKGYIANRAKPIGTRPVLRISEPDSTAQDTTGKTAKATTGKR
ncbi:MAG TPA: hypothetical protein VFD82_08705 [Planctomycetota bacterium]|nr:hypothetical protein [Planctomycetota bacterium]